MIPRFRPALGLGEIAALFRPVRGSVERFERAFAERFGGADAIAFPYGRSALWAMFKALGISDAEIVVPPYTCSVVGHAIALSDNRPRFVDIRLDDYNMDLDQLEDAINQNTRAVVATHLYGYPLDADRIARIVADAEARFGHKIWVIQDCAHSFDTRWRGKPVAREGDAALFGLNISKSMTSIFGGMLTVADQDVAKTIRRWRDEHYSKPSWLKGIKRRLYLLAAWVAFSNPGYGFVWWLQHRTRLLDGLARDYHLDDKIHFPPDHLDHMLDVEAAVGLVQLEKYDRLIELRRQNAAWYDRHLPRNDEWVLPPVVDDATYSHYVVRVPDRDRLVADAARVGVELGQVIDYSIADLESYKSDGLFPNSTKASQSVINLPLIVGERDRQRVLDAVRMASC